MLLLSKNPRSCDIQFDFNKMFVCCTFFASSGPSFLTTREEITTSVLLESFLNCFARMVTLSATILGSDLRMSLVPTCMINLSGCLR